MAVETRESIEMAIEKLFNEADTDRDGLLSAEDHWHYQKKCAEMIGIEPNEEASLAFFNSIDKQKTGLASKSEICSKIFNDWKAVNEPFKEVITDSQIVNEI